MRKITNVENTPEITDSLSSLPKDSKIFIEKTKAISNRISLFIAATDLKQKGLADKMGKSEAEVSKLLSGTQNLTLRTIAKVESVLGIELIKIPGNKNENFDIETDVSGFYAVKQNVPIEMVDTDWRDSIPAKVVFMESQKGYEKVLQAV
jgi:transcriptional regulator with XRE-family HTH domain